MKFLFVCLGNICRSPTAEAIFRHHLEPHFPEVVFDSAGTAAYHIGEPSDHRSIDHAEKRGYKMTHLARQVCDHDFYEFDILFAMDESNFQNLMQMCPEDHLKTKIHLITDFATQKGHKGVPDPYYGGPQGFDFVIDLLESCMGNVRKNFLEHTKRKP